mgnify:CR=1 FL=1
MILKKPPLLELRIGFCKLAGLNVDKRGVSLGLYLVRPKKRAVRRVGDSPRTVEQCENGNDQPSHFLNFSRIGIRSHELFDGEERVRQGGKFNSSLPSLPRVAFQGLLPDRCSRRGYVLCRFRTIVGKVG